MEPQLRKENYHISGMHCRSCEIIVEDNLSKVPGVQRVNVDHQRGVAEVYYNHRPIPSEIERAIRNSGYTLGVNKKRPLISRDPVTYIQLIFTVGILLVVLIWLKILGVFDLNLQFSAAPSFMIVMLIGLTAGISTCMALVGGLVLGISSRHSKLHPEATAGQKFKPHLFFNLGRLVSYGLLGGAIGSLGSVLKLSSPMLGALVIFAGVIMLILGLKMTELFPRLDSGFTMPKSISRMFGLNQEMKEYSHKSSFITGALTFFLPCGFTQAMQIYAVSTGSFTKGTTIMALFALGTMPGLLGIGSLTSLVKGAFAQFFFKFVALVLIAFSILNISNGFNLTGITFASSGAAGKTISGQIVNGEQIVNLTQSAAGYSPRELTIKKNVPVKLMVNSTNPYTCTSILVIPKFNIWSKLTQGINEIKFTPTAKGPVKFSCSMGMYTGVINVID